MLPPENSKIVVLIVWTSKIGGGGFRICDEGGQKGLGSLKIGQIGWRNLWMAPKKSDPLPKALLMESRTFRRKGPADFGLQTYLNFCSRTFGLLSFCTSDLYPFDFFPGCVRTFVCFTFNEKFD